MDTYQTPSSIASGQSAGNTDYPGESVSGDTTVQGREYRARSIEYISTRDSGGGTVIGYVSTGYRSDASHGVPDVDFDDKQAYESIEKFQDRRVKPDNNGAHPSTAPQPGKFEMPDYVTKKGWLSLRRCLCFFIILSIVTLLVSVVGAAIGVYAFLSVFEGGRLFGMSPIEGSTGAQSADLTVLQEQLLESNMLIDELRANLSRVNENHMNNFADLTQQLSVILNTPTTVNNTDTSSVNVSEGVNLYSQCVTQSFGTCMLEANNLVGIVPSFSSCETPSVALTQPGMVNMDIHCGLANRLGERNPITASLNLYDGAVSCACYLVATQTPQRDVECTLYMTRCPGMLATS